MRPDARTTKRIAEVWETETDSRKKRIAWGYEGQAWQERIDKRGGKYRRECATRRR